jgi:hypothetical protein
MKILICGDSFAADWTLKYPNVCGWPNMLATKYDVTNIAECGISEYKIWQQLKSVDIDSFDICVISHTSPLRVHTRCHPVHSKDILHKNADLMLNDISYHNSKLVNMFNNSLKTASNWFKYHYDLQYQQDIYELVRSEISKILKNIFVIKITNFEGIQNKFSYSKYLKTNPGIANHFDYTINQLICDDLTEEIKMANERQTK